MARNPGKDADKIVPLKGVKPPSLAALAYEQVYGDIMGGKLAPGRKLLVAELHETYGIGLSPLRDALNRLCADGLVTKHEQKGFFVADLDEAELLEITNLRLVLEDTALRLSIIHGDTAWEERIVLAFYRLSKAASTDGAEYLLTPAWSAAHQEFHFALLEACGNEWLIGFCRKLYEQLTRYRARRRLISASSSPLRGTLVQEHRDILDACIARDADRASRLLIEHYQRSFELVANTRFQLLEQPLRLVPIQDDGNAAASTLERAGEAETAAGGKSRRSRPASSRKQRS